MFKNIKSCGNTFQTCFFIFHFLHKIKKFKFISPKKKWEPYGNPFQN